MPITMEDYYRKGHIFFETHEGREDIFRLYKENIEEGLKEGNISKSVSRIELLRGYLRGDSALFHDPDLPNIWRLKNKQGEIKEDALKFLKDNIDLFKRAYLFADKAYHKFCILALFIRFIPEITDLRLRHYTDLYLLLFHTMLSFDTFEGSSKDKSALTDALLLGYGWYDCKTIGERFIMNTRLKELLKEYTMKYPPHEEYVKRLKEAIRKMSILAWDSINEEDFAPLIFTDRLFLLFDELNNGLIKDLFQKNQERIDPFITSRCNELFKEKNEERDILNSAAKDILNEKAHQLKSSIKQYTKTLPQLLSLRQQIEVL